jgi:hypothetical protein
MTVDKLHLAITVNKPGQPSETWDTYYVVGYKPDGMTLRMVIEDQLELEPGDTVVFDFTKEKI